MINMRRSASIYAVVRNAYAKPYTLIERFRKTNQLVREHIGTEPLMKISEFVMIDENTIDLIRQRRR
jgi:hypothetical protein